MSRGLSHAGDGPFLARGTQLGSATALGLVLAAAVLRLAFVAVWPEVQADEGLWTIGVKNFVQFSDWFHDDRTHLLLSPLFHVLAVPLFEVFEAGIPTARYVSGVAGVATVALLIVLVHRTTGRWLRALIVGVLAAVNVFSVFLSRTALIESLELLMITGTAVALTANSGWRRTLGAALLLCLAMLTKLNAGFFVVVAGVALLWSRDGRLGHDREGAAHSWVARVRGTGPIVLGVALAAFCYGLLYLWQPGRFADAFAFELGVGARIEVDPILAIGRFGLAPAESAESILGLFRQMPFVMVLASMGVAIRAFDGFDEERLFIVWLVVGGGFFVFQLYQPLRYAYLFFPCLVYFAAVAMETMGSQIAGAADATEAWPDRRLGAVLAVYLVFQLAYLAAGVYTNRGVRLRAVENFGRDIPESARLLGAPFLCVNLSQECLPHYRIVGRAESVIDTLESLQIDYVIVDDGEWSATHRKAIEDAYTAVETWSFGAAYRVRPVTKTDAD